MSRRVVPVAAAGARAGANGAVPRARRRTRSKALTTGMALTLVAGPALASGGGSAANVALTLAIILLAAKLMGHLATRLGQPAVLGELVAGLLLGNAQLAGVPWFVAMKTDSTLEVMAELGVMILLFEVGLESTVRDMLKVGWSSLIVAVLGVVTPFALGWGASRLVVPEAGPYAHVFIGATLTATSVGITARVLRDLGRSQGKEARIILGAAVIDDVLGLVLLAVISGVIQAANAGGSVAVPSILLVLGKAMIFLFGSLALGTWLSPHLFRLASRLRGGGVLIGTTLACCFAMAYVASLVGLAPIVGAYAAGLILENAHFVDFEGEHQLEELVAPISALLVPVFFVLMGMRVDLRAFSRVEVLGLAGVLTLAAVAGKQACSLGALGRSLDRLSIGIGMIPRGEVGLIFANIGLGLTVGGKRVIDEATFSAVVIMVMLTTMLAPPALRWSLRRGDRLRAEREGPPLPAS